MLRERKFFCGKKSLLSCDLNVPIKFGVVQDATRINAIIPTLRKVISQSPKAIILASHLGRPNGKVEASLSLHPICTVLESILEFPIIFLSDCVGPDVEREVNGNYQELR